MDAEHWRHVEQVCQAALERGLSEQPAFLDEACAGDEALRREVESLLAHQTQAEPFLEAPVLAVAAEALAHDESYQSAQAHHLIGRVLSDYRIVEKLGGGGMGEVYRAVRADGTYDKHVAIKLVQSGLSTDYFLARFKNERQILASLDHPNIARLIDGGSTEEGLPYVVMECIEGQPIDEYCAEYRLGIPERLELFRMVCTAVQYAHKNLIVHRDLKPGNILVTKDGVPKLLDFGIAKILHPENAPQEINTVTLFPLMTPDYASPEQIRGDAITTSSDVYSLGVILYVLLTDGHPHRKKGTGPHELIKAICEVEPEKPSTAVDRPRPSGAKSATSPEAVESSPPEVKKRRRALAGDLDNIVLKALRKEPERRYATVEQFSEDIRRYLLGLPVIAHKDSSRYRARKFIARHRLGVAAAALLALSLVGGMIATLWQARVARYERARAEHRFNDVRALANSLMFDINDSIQNLAGSTPARKLLVTKALQYLDSLSREATGDPSLQKELATAYEKVGDLQGDTLAANLGDTAGALVSYRKAMAIREAIAAGDGNSVDNQTDLAVAYQKLSSGLAASGDYPASLNYGEKFFAIQQRLAAMTPGPESQERLAGAYFQVAWCQTNLGDFSSALGALQKSATIREAITEAAPELIAGVQVRLAGTYGRIAFILGRQGRTGEAVARYSKASEILRKLSESDPTNAMYREYLSEGLYYTGYYLHLGGQLEQALKKYEEGLKGFEMLSSTDLREARSKRFVGLCYRQIGTIQVARNRSAQGLESIRKAIAIAEELYRLDPTEKSDKLTDLSDDYAALGFAYSRLAVQPNISINASFILWKDAQAAYQRSLGMVMEMKRRGALSALDDGEPDRIAGELAACDAALAKFTSPQQRSRREKPQ